jgi:hypothetical protein
MEEIVNLPMETREAADDTAGGGLWVEVFCPDHSCLTQEEEVSLQVRAARGEQGRGFWLNLFCPEEQCALEEPTDIA